MDEQINSLTNYEKCIAEYMSDPIEAGEVCGKEKARSLLEAYFNVDGNDGPNENVYGHTFGLNKIKKLLEKIEHHNGVSGSEKIRGIRIYYALSARGGDINKINRDLIMVPVTAGNCDLFPINRFAPDGCDRPGEDLLSSNGYFLGESRPCPNQCSLLED